MESENLSPTKEDDEKWSTLKKAFQAFDKNNIGKINASELKQVLTAQENVLSSKEVEEFISAVGVDEDDNIDYMEYIKAMQK